MDLLKSSSHAVVIAPAKARDNSQISFGRLLGSFQNRANSGGINRNWFFNKHVHTRINSQLHMLRPEVWWRTEENDIDTCSQHVLAAIEAGELVGIIDSNATCKAVVRLQILQ